MKEPAEGECAVFCSLIHHAHDIIATMIRRALHQGIFALIISLGTLTLACEEKKTTPPSVEKKAAKLQPDPEPEVKAPPHLVIGDEGMFVRGTEVTCDKKTGTIPPVELAKLKNYLNDEKEFIQGKAVQLVVDRKAKRGWVAPFLAELGALGASKITVKTETRQEFSAELEFIPESQGKELPACTMIGAITKHNGSALWTLKGGRAKERGPGLGGPDLSMAKEEFIKGYKNCESDVFVTDAENDKNWGFIYDIAAAAVSAHDVGINRALLPYEPKTKGRKVRFQ